MTKLPILKSLFLSFAVVATFSGCGEYKTVGKVDMSKLITLEELWQNRYEMVGKVVTIKLDTVSASSSNGGSRIQGIDFPSYTFWTTLTQIISDQMYWDRVDSLRKTNAQCEELWAGSCIIQIIKEGKFPWINNTVRRAKLPTEETFSKTLQYSPERYFTGVLVGGFLDCTGYDSLAEEGYKNWGEQLEFPGEKKQFKWCTPSMKYSCRRDFFLIPTGYRYKIGHLDQREMSN